MMKKAIVLSLIVVLITGCQSEEVTKLREENALLKSILDDPRFLRAELAEVNMIVDDIDATRKVNASERQNITSFVEFKARLNDVHNHIKKSEQKLRSLEKELTVLRNETSAYTMMVYALKGEVSIRDEDVVVLSSTLKNFQQKNAELLDSVRFQEDRAAGLHSHIEDKQRKLSALETKMIAMENDFKRTEAEVYYAKGQLLEESARKVRLAPQKRKQSFTEALELYRKAYTLGKKEAAKNISILEQSLGVNSNTSVSRQAPELKW
jgi:septal ring factor EnvC (AmiA/AmiB activator)